MKTVSRKKSLEQGRHRARKMGIETRKRTIMFCLDKKTAKCASGKQMSESWKHLRKRLKQWGLTGDVLRLKLGCVGICRGGPIAVVMPEGSWYGGCTPEVLDEILQKHVIGGVPVEEYLLAQAPPLHLVQPASEVVTPTACEGQQDDLLQVVD